VVEYVGKDEEEEELNAAVDLGSYWGFVIEGVLGKSWGGQGWRRQQQQAAAGGGVGVGGAEGSS
jgi:hypothetical protein